MEPESIRLTNKSARPVERFVMLRSEKPFEITDSVLEHAEGTVRIEKPAPGTWKIRLTLVPGGLGSGAVLRIRTTCPQQPDIAVLLSVVR